MGTCLKGDQNLTLRWLCATLAKYTSRQLVMLTRWILYIYEIANDLAISRPFSNQSDWLSTRSTCPGSIRVDSVGCNVWRASLVIINVLDMISLDARSLWWPWSIFGHFNWLSEKLLHAQWFCNHAFHWLNYWFFPEYLAMVKWNFVFLSFVFKIKAKKKTTSENKIMSPVWFMLHFQGS